MKRVLLLLLILITPLLLFSDDDREYQFQGDRPGESYFIAEGGSNVSLSLLVNSVELSAGYSYLFGQGFNISSDLYFYSTQLTPEISLYAGLGGGIIFNSSISDGFSSNIYLRLPLRLTYNQWFLKVNPMPGATMFEMEMGFKFAFSITFGYMFDLYKVDVKPEEIEENQ